MKSFDEYNEGKTKVPAHITKKVKAAVKHIDSIGSILESLVDEDGVDYDVVTDAMEKLGMLEELVSDIEFGYGE